MPQIQIENGTAFIGGWDETYYCSECKKITWKGASCCPECANRKLINVPFRNNTYFVNGYESRFEVEVMIDNKIMVVKVLGGKKK